MKVTAGCGDDAHMVQRIHHLRADGGCWKRCAHIRQLIFGYTVAEPPTETVIKGVKRAFFGYDEAVLTTSRCAPRPGPRQCIYTPR